MKGTAEADSPRVGTRNRLLPLVAKSAPGTLSRWRHGFKYCCGTTREALRRRCVYTPVKVETRVFSVDPETLAGHERRVLDELVELERPS
jgi:hypothetical protein